MEVLKDGNKGASSFIVVAVVAPLSTYDFSSFREAERVQPRGDETRERLNSS